MKRRDDTSFTGLDALEEIARRLQDLAGSASGEGSHTEKAFTIETPLGPLNGMMGMTVRTLADRAKEMRRPNASTPRPEPRRPSPASPQPDRMIDIFEEEHELLVLVDAQSEAGITVSAELMGAKLILRNTKDGSVFEAIDLPRDTAGCYAALHVNNGVIEVRIARPQGQ